MKPIRNKQPEHRAPQRKRIENTHFSDELVKHDTQFSFNTSPTWNVFRKYGCQKMWCLIFIFLSRTWVSCWNVFESCLLNDYYYHVHTTYMNVLGYLWLLVNISSISSCFPNTPFHSTNTIWLKLKTLWKGCI